MRFLEDPEGRPPISELGWDPLLNMPALEEFQAALAKQRRAIKALLLDQVTGEQWRLCVWTAGRVCNGPLLLQHEPVAVGRRVRVLHVARGFAEPSLACHHGWCMRCLHPSSINLHLLQSFCAGVGNWVADEVLYQVRPASPLCSSCACELLPATCQACGLVVLYSAPATKPWPFMAVLMVLRAWRSRPCTRDAKSPAADPVLIFCCAVTLAPRAAGQHDSSGAGGTAAVRCLTD